MKGEWRSASTVNGEPFVMTIGTTQMLRLFATSLASWMVSQSPSTHTPHSSLYPSHTHAGTPLAVQASLFAVGDGIIFLDEVGCVGNESRLVDCVSVNEVGQHNCFHSEDAGVICPGRYCHVNTVYALLSSS